MSHPSPNPSYVRPQLPAALKGIDDRYGLLWRSYNAARRCNPWFAARWAAASLSRAEFHKPIFIMGIPRSATTAVFRWLGAAFPNLGHEGHNIWRLFHHPRRHAWRSDEVFADDVIPGERRIVSGYFRAKLGRGRFVEKTPCNCFRIPYLLKLLPSALVLVVHRNPQMVLRSLISGWKDPAGRFRNYYLPVNLSIPDYLHTRRWCFTLVPGWREMIDRPVAEVALHQWSQYVDAITAARQSVPASQWREIHLEDVVASPESIGESVAQYVDVSPAGRDHFDAALRNLTQSPANSLRPGEHAAIADVERLNLQMAPRASSIGYALVDGEFRRAPVRGIAPKCAASSKPLRVTNPLAPR